VYRLFKRVSAFDIGLMALGAALNVSVGYLVNLFKLPFFLDSIGTVLITALCGWGYGVAVGVSGVLILAITANPTVIAYVGTSFVIATVAALLIRIGFLKTVRMTILGGIVLGIVSSASSAPVTTLLYGGVSLAGSDAITAFLKAFGLPLWKSVLISSVMTDVFDKVCTGIICFMLIRSLPARLLARIKGTVDSSAERL